MIDLDVQYSNVVFPWLLSQSSKHTRRAYERIIKSFISSVVEFSIEKVTPIEVAQFLSEVRSSGGQSKYNQARSALASFFDFQIRAGFLAVNPVLAFKTKRVPLPTLRFLPDENIYFRVVGAEPILRNQLMFHMTFVLGLRLFELLGTRFSSFVFGPYGEVYLHILGKGGRNRDVLIPEWLWGQIKQYISIENLGMDDFLFYTPNDKSKSLSHVRTYRIFITAGERIGLKLKMNPHKYRHGHATTALSKGASFKGLMDQMGHADWETLRRYVTQAEFQQPSSLFNEPLLQLEAKS